MEQQIDYANTAKGAYSVMMEMEKYLKTSHLDPKLLQLVKIRASEINGCGYCLNMHTKEARNAGESEQRLYCVSAWRECTFYTDAEQAALELCESITLIPAKGVPDALYERVRKYFDENDYVDLLFAINQINCWNRLSIATGTKAMKA
ncbi:carboxymuconolactone decarboxylase family protein [Listeria valentina]|uniref:carboxymuconolactone decarboxylase family protein n=1 Tax=Listeria valentina TaxID=2705293 RepID=UPI0014304BD3|nr:carboxymuconolactone decarboxylase family protein [Listeria valentina]